MSPTVKVLIPVAIVWVALMPPLFTSGACTAEFDHEATALELDKDAIKSSAKASVYFRDRLVPYAVMTLDECRKRKPRSLDRCPGGGLIIAKVPVKDSICKLYRDDEIKITLLYDTVDRLSRMELDMSPYKSLPIPFTDIVIYWAR